MPASNPGGARFLFCKAGQNMTKRQLIDEIININRSARADFLAKFGDSDLDEYLRHLLAVKRPRRQAPPDQPGDAAAASAPSKGGAEIAVAEGTPGAIDDRFTNEQTPAKQPASAPQRPAACHRGQIAMAAASDRERDRTIRSSIADERSQRWLF